MSTMTSSQAPLRRLGLPGSALLLTMAASVTGCAHVKPEQLDSELTTLREEMRGEIVAGDRELENRMMGLEGRVDDLDTRMDAVEQELNRIADEFDAAVERFEMALRFDMPVYFGFDDADLTPEHREILDRFAGVIREFCSDCLITAEGFTDPAGSEDYNKQLGQRRADAVKAYLAAAGLPTEQIRTVSYGESAARQIAQGAQGPGERGWENRRVALVVDHGGAS